MGRSPLYRPESATRRHISVRAETFDRIADAAAKSGMSMSKWVEERINAFLDRKGFHLTRFILLPSAAERTRNETRR